jgi:single-strand DNA-binding protein
MNNVALSGNLTRDPELRATPSGMVVLNMGIAVNERKKSSSGDWEDVPNYFDLVMFGKRAESVSKLLAKGTKVAVSGRLHWSSWKTKEGQKRSKVDVYVDDIEIFSSKKTSDETADYIYDEDVPF